VSLIEHMATTHRSLQVVIRKLNRTLFPVLLNLATSWAIKTDEQICVRVLGCLAPGESSTTSDEGLTDSRVKLNSHHAETRRDETRRTSSVVIARELIKFLDERRRDCTPERAPIIALVT